MDPKIERISGKSPEIESILDQWGFVRGSIARDQKTAQIKQWLSNFRASEIDDAFLILSRIQYKDDNVIRAAVAHLSEEIRAVLQGNLSGAKFFPLGGSPSSSGGMYLYDYRKELLLTEDHFPYSRFDDKRLHASALIFFDDMIGSGNQAIKFARKNLMGLGAHLYYVSVFAFEDGLRKVRQQGSFRYVFCGSLLTDEERAFHENTQVFTDEKTRKRLRCLCETYGARLFPRHPLGYDDSQALLVFPHNTPNNTLPVIWAGSDNEKAPGYPWHPVFERKKRVGHPGIRTSPSDSSATRTELFDMDGALLGNLTHSKLAIQNLTDLGKTQTTLSYYDEAIRSLHQARRMNRLVNNQRVEAVIECSLGAVYYNQAKYQTAIKHFMKALALAGRANDTNNLCVYLCCVAMAHRGLAQFTLATKRLREAIKAARKTGNRRVERACLNYLGRTYRNAGKLRLASHHL